MYLHLGLVLVWVAVVDEESEIEGLEQVVTAKEAVEGCGLVGLGLTENWSRNRTSSSSLVGVNGLAVCASAFGTGDGVGQGGHYVSCVVLRCGVMLIAVVVELGVKVERERGSDVQVVVGFVCLQSTEFKFGSSPWGKVGFQVGSHR